MPQTTLYDKTGASVGKVELTDDLFAAPVNAAVLHQVVIAQLAGRRPRHARHQDPRRSPRRRPQAVPPEGHRPRPPGPSRPPRTSAAAASVFGPHPRSYEQRLPRKMKRLALRGALTAKFGDDAIRIIDTFGLDAIKTRDFVDVLAALKAGGRVLVVAPGSRPEARALVAQPARRSR